MSAPYPRPHRDFVTASIEAKRRHDQRVKVAVRVLVALAIVAVAAIGWPS